MSAADKTREVWWLRATNCVECIMAWLLYGDGAICLLHRAPVYALAPPPEGPQP